MTQSMTIEGGRGLGGRANGARWGLGLVVAGGVMAGCAGSETGNGQQTGARRPVTVVVQLAGNPSLASVDADGAELAIESGVALVDQIEIALPEGADCELPTVVPSYDAHCDDGRERLEVDGPWSVDLVSGEIWPPIEGLSLPEGELGPIQLKLKGAGRDASPALSLEGVFRASAGAAARPFTLDVSGTVVARFDSEEALLVSGTTTGIGLWFDVSTWFSTLHLGSCVTSGGVPEVDGVLVLDRAEKRTCGNVEAALRSALTSTGRARSE